MRIIHSLEGNAWSGGQQQTLFLAEHQQRLGHDVLLLCQKNSVLQEKATAAGLNILPVDYRTELNPYSISLMLRAFDRFNPDIVNVHRAWAHTQWLLISLLRRFKGLVVARRVFFRPDRNPVSLAKYRSRAVSGYIAVSNAVKCMLMQIGVPEKKIRVVFSGSDTGVFSPDKSSAIMKKIDGLPDDAPCALIVGNYSKNKGHEVVLKAFTKAGAQVKELHLLVAGKDTDCQTLKMMVQEMGLKDRVHLLGYRSDVAWLLQRCRFSVNASFKEGFSGTVRESLLMGTPVIASEIPANLEIHHMIPLSLFAPGDAEGLARQMIKLSASSSDSDFRSCMHDRAASFFSVEKMVADTMAAYLQYLSR